MPKSSCKYCIYNDKYHGGCNKFKVMPKRRCDEYTKERKDKRS